MGWLEDLGFDVGDRTTGQVKIDCPECGHKRSLSINLDERVYKCHYSLCNVSGGAGGGRKRGGTVKPTVLTTLNKELIPEYTPANIRPNQYLIRRGISETTQAQLAGAVGTDEASGEPVFIYRNLDGEITNVKKRYRDADGDKGFHVTGGSIHQPYLVDMIPSGASTIVITEGEIDALSAWEAGHYAISMPNGAVPDPKWLGVYPDMFLDAHDIIIAVDNDAAGRSIQEAIAARVGRHKAYRVMYPDGCKDLNEVLVNYDAQFVSELIRDAEPWPVEGIISPASVKDRLFDLYDGINNTDGLRLGMGIWDDMFTIVPGHLTIVTGTPFSGKSEFVDYMMVKLAKHHGRRCAIYSPEYYPPERYEVKWIEKYTGSSFYGWNGGERISREDAGIAADWVNEHMNMLMPENPTLSSLLELATIEAMRNDIAVLVIDNWSEIIQEDTNVSETQWVKSELTILREWARRHHVSVIVVTHPTKVPKTDDGNYVVVRPYDIMGSAYWFNKADNIISVWRDLIGTRLVEVHVQKIRYKESGQIGMCEFEFRKWCGRYQARRAVTASGVAITSGYMPDKDGAVPVYGAAT